MKKAVTANKTGAKDADGASPTKMIDGRIKELGDWRGETLKRIRALIKEADPDVVEEWKWRGVPVWEHDGIICTGETYKALVKLTFARARRWTTRPACSIPASMAMCGARSIFPRAPRSTKRR